MELKKVALSGFFWSFSERFLTKGIGFIVSIILARLLLPKEFGLLGMIYLFTGIGNILINSGLSHSLIRSKNLTQKDYSTVFFFNLGGSIFVYLIMFLIAPVIANFYDQEVLIQLIRIYCLTFIIDAFGSIQKTRLTIEMNFKRQMHIALPALILSSIISLSMAYSNLGVWSLVWGAVSYSFFATLLFWILSNWKPVLLFNKEKFKEHFFFGYKLTLSGIVNVVFNNLYYIIIGKYFSVNQVGYYNRAETLKEFPISNLSIVLDKITYPMFSRVQDDSVKLKSAYKQIMQLVIFIISPTMVILAVIADPLFITLFTEKWLPAAPMFKILALSGILFPIQVYNRNILKLKGRTDLVLKLTILIRSISLIAIVVSFNYGLYALLWSQVFMAILTFLINSHYSKRFIDYSKLDQLKDIYPSLFASAVVGLSLFYIKYLLPTLSNLVLIILLPIVGLVIYALIAFTFKLKPISIIKNLFINE